MVTKKSTLKGIIVVLVLAVLAMGYSMYTTSSKNSKETYVADNESQKTEVQENTSKTNEGNLVGTTYMEEGIVDETGPSISVVQDSCEKDLAAKIKSEKTEYEKGRILVGFNKDISLSAAKKVLAKYDLAAVATGTDEESYASLHLITVNVPTGREVHFVCFLKKDSSIRYTNINTYVYTSSVE